MEISHVIAAQYYPHELLSRMRVNVLFRQGHQAYISLLGRKGCGGPEDGGATRPDVSRAMISQKAPGRTLLSSGGFDVDYVVGHCALATMFDAAPSSPVRDETCGICTALRNSHGE